MELRVLRYFLAVAREENITKAAALLHLTQPTLSRQLMQLEEELGVRLFHRSRYHIVLTDEGMLLRRRAQELVELADKTAREFRQAPELRGEISIGSGDLEGMSLLAELLTSFQALHPQVTYRIYSGNADNTKERIEGGMLDLGLLLEPVDISKYDFIRLPVKEQWGIHVRADDPLAEREAVTARELVGVPLIFTQRDLVQKELERWFGPYGRQLQVAATGNLPYNMAQLARAGMGAFLTIKLRCEYQGLRFLPLSPPLEASTVLAWKKTETFPPAMGALLEHIKREIDHKR
ncbi:LysR family transcriptional regulator [Pseudoflavonifractor phocaeensis]|uniref:LysR family transcriptional regulator n=1 Tax=Pseudoflavonifractor phocaeensis TaxID=1870988 RepID=UPI00195ADB12|nr:LysR family transcriptional regulator [Pseudoflavonifractor phocaeensis]MBM6937441.1 LysR family transcriptional regulator [Pseudoflavonifractor phocaeensis]